MYRQAKDDELDEETNALSGAIIGAAIEVHRVLGPGLLETLYEEALCVELRLQGTTFARQVPVPIKYKGHSIGDGRLDLLVRDQLLLS